MNAPPTGTGPHVLDIVFVVDCSGSMAGDRIGALNWAARTVVPAMRAHAEEHPGVEPRLRVLRFATGATFATPYPEPLARFVWTSLAAFGESDMGAALRLLADAFAREGRAAERLPPVIVLFSDGYPSDDAEDGLAVLLATDLGRRAIRIPIAIGQDADMALLRRFASDPDRPPLRSQDIETLVLQLHRLVTGPLAKAVSDGARPSGGAAMTPGPARGADEDEDTW